jgi:hypothetical protein
VAHDEQFGIACAATIATIIENVPGLEDAPDL